MTVRTGVEVEVKFRATADGMAAVLASPLFTRASPPVVHKLRSVYFDTADHRLYGQRTVLRVRYNDGETPVLGLKSSAGTGRNFSRREIEVPVPGGLPDPRAFEPEVAAELEAVVGGRPLEPQFETAVTRQIFDLKAGRSVVEAACDAGDIIAGSRREPLLELELELKSGAGGDLFELAERLAAGLPLVLEFTSKSERGFFLARCETPKPVKAREVAFPPDATLDDAVALTLASTLDHFVANWAVLRMRDDPEAVHQMRVALRRMRTALSIFGHLLEVPRFRMLRHEAKRIAQGFGQAREWDVLSEMVGAAMSSGDERPNGLDALLKAVEIRRGDAYRVARALVDHDATTGFVLELEAALARRGWSDVAAVKPARKGLDRLWLRLLERGKGFSQLGDRKRHALRIALKDLRYGIDFLAGLFGPNSRIKQFSKRVAALQELLGDRNDLVVARLAVKDLIAAEPGVFDQCAKILLARIGARNLSGERALRGAWRALKRMEPFWR